MIVSFKAILHTQGKDAEKNMEQYTEDEKNIMREYMKAWDGVQVIVGLPFRGERPLYGWEDEWEDKAKEAIYLMEQDPVFGMYIDDREGFDKDWEAGEYEPAGTISFSEDMVEILGRLENNNGQKRDDEISE